MRHISLRGAYRAKQGLRFDDQSRIDLMARGRGLTAGVLQRATLSYALTSLNRFIVAPSLNGGSHLLCIPLTL